MTWHMDWVEPLEYLLDSTTTRGAEKPRIPFDQFQEALRNLGIPRSSIPVRDIFAGYETPEYLQAIKEDYKGNLIFNKNWPIIAAYLDPSQANVSSYVLNRFPDIGDSAIRWLDEVAGIKPDSNVSLRLDKYVKEGEKWNWQDVFSARLLRPKGKNLQKFSQWFNEQVRGIPELEEHIIIHGKKIAVLRNERTTPIIEEMMNSYENRQEMRRAKKIDIDPERFGYFADKYVHSDDEDDFELRSQILNLLTPAITFYAEAMTGIRPERIFRNGRRLFSPRIEPVELILGGQYFVDQFIRNRLSDSMKEYSLEGILKYVLHWLPNQMVNNYTKNNCPSGVSQEASRIINLNGDLGRKSLEMKLNEGYKHKNKDGLNVLNIVFPEELDENIEDDNLSPAEALEQKDLFEHVREIAWRFPNQRHVKIALDYLFEEGPGEGKVTFESIGIAYGLTRERVRQISDKVLKFIRNGVSLLDPEELKERSEAVDELNEFKRDVKNQGHFLRNEIGKIRYGNLLERLNRLGKELSVSKIRYRTLRMGFGEDDEKTSLARKEYLGLLKTRRILREELESIPFFNE